jgi:hypothetical protein
VTFAAGETSLMIPVTVYGDALAESDEYFYIQLSQATNASISDGWGYFVIINDDTTPAISISDVSKSEGKSGTTRFVFTVTLSAASDAPVTVNYATANGTATTRDNDYIAKSGKLTFAPGETSKKITISVKGDKKQEDDESFFVNLANAKGALIDDGQGVGIILSDDGSRRSGNWRNQLAFASAVDQALEDWMTSRPKKRW